MERVWVITEGEAHGLVRDLDEQYQYTGARRREIVVTPHRDDAPALLALLKEAGYKARYANHSETRESL